MKKEKLVIWGASGHASVIADIVNLQGVYEIIGFLDDVNIGHHHTEFCGASILGGKEQLPGLFKDGVKTIHLGFGNCPARIELAKLVRAQGFALANAIHPDAVIARNVTLGTGVAIMAGVVINPGVILGDTVIVNTCASVDHDCIIGEGVHVCPGVRLAGSVEIGRGSMIGIGTVVKEKIRIGEFTTVGAGSVVVKDLPAHVTAFGAPARVRRPKS